ncbi:unnamed protein product [Durusdinium trenchii]|uniref:catechol O-methyltransferase n=1 Tax=Durusdinium trenchii TaxID=1381693 RepID=A0ABP0PVI9_9DINO
MLSPHCHMMPMEWPVNGLHWQDLLVDSPECAMPDEVAQIGLVVEIGRQQTKAITVLRKASAASAWRVSSLLLDELSMRSWPPDVVFWSSLGSAYSGAGKWQLALWALLEAPRAAHLEPNVVSYSSAMTACERVSLWEMVLNLLVEAEQLPEKANAFSYSSAIVACGQVESGWQRALALWSQMISASQPSPNVVAFNATLTALERATCWQLACSLLEQFEDQTRSNLPLTPDALSYSAVATACPWPLGLWWLLRAREKRELKAGPGPWSCLARKMGHDRAWQEALQLLSGPIEGDRLGEVWCSVMWAMEVSGFTSEPPFRVRRDRVHQSKEFSLLDFIVTRVPRGDLSALLATVKRFAGEKEWLKVAGGSKARLLQAVLRPGDRILELGCFVGFSALLMVQRLRRLGGGGKVITCEVNAVSAFVARELIRWAGAEAEIEVRVGLAGDWIATGQLGVPDVVILDHRGARYHEDLLALEPMREHARIIADNVLSPGAPLFLNFVDGRYAIAIHEVDEFLRARADWVVTCSPRLLHRPVQPVPGEFLGFAAEIDRLCWRSSLKAGRVQRQDWVDLEEQLSPVLHQWASKRGLLSWKRRELLH